MNFCEFSNLLYEVLGGGNKSAFVKKLFESIVLESDIEAQTIIEAYSDDAYKSYIRVNKCNDITVIARKLMSHLEPENFAEFIDEFTYDAWENLCNQFKPYIPDIDVSNVGESLAELFMQIIKKAATSKRSSSSKKNGENTEVETTEDVSLTNDETEQVEAQVLEDDKEENKNTIINQQANIIQNGPNNYNLTNNGVMNFNF